MPSGVTSTSSGDFNLVGGFSIVGAQFGLGNFAIGMGIFLDGFDDFVGQFGRIDLHFGLGDGAVSGEGDAGFDAVGGELGFVFDFSVLVFSEVNEVNGLPRRGSGPRRPGLSAARR